MVTSNAGVVTCESIAPRFVDTTAVSGPNSLGQSTYSSSVTVTSYLMSAVSVVDVDNVRVPLNNNSADIVNQRQVMPGRNKTGFIDYTDTIVVHVDRYYPYECAIAAVNTAKLKRSKSEPLTDIDNLFLSWSETVRVKTPIGQNVRISFEYIIPAEKIFASEHGLFHRQTGLLFVLSNSTNVAFNPLSISDSEYRVGKKISDIGNIHMSQSIIYVNNNDDAGDRFAVIGGLIYRIRRQTTKEAACDEGVYITTNVNNVVGSGKTGVMCRRYALDEPVCCLPVYDSLDAAKSCTSYVEYLKYLKERQKVKNDSSSNIAKLASEWAKLALQVISTAVAVFALFKKAT